MPGKSDVIWAKVTVIAPLNGAATELFTCEMFWGAAPGGPIPLAPAEPWLPAGQAVVVAYVSPVAVTGPELGEIVSAPGWAPTAAFACAALKPARAIAAKADNVPAARPDRPIVW